MGGPPDHIDTVYEYCTHFLSFWQVFSTHPGVYVLGNRPARAPIPAVKKEKGKKEKIVLAFADSVCYYV
jgi:hypothetical protein